MEFTHLIDLASERVGGAAILANDEFFAPKENLVRLERPVWREGEYTERGKWMDGWETRRRREPGYDWCVVQLGLPGVIHGMVVDTSYFTGNYPEACSLEARAEDGTWCEILSRRPLEGNAENLFSIEPVARYTHVRLNIYPDGGVARLRVFGVPAAVEGAVAPGSDIDLAAPENGGHVVDASDRHYGNPQNMLLPGDPLGMYDGWETRRRRGPGHDWAVVRLGAMGRVHRIVVDTRFFKGNAPGECSVDYCDVLEPLPAPDADWRELLPRAALRADEVHEFEWDVGETAPATHLRLNIHPDGGVARFRAFGIVEGE
ncbi:MAG TPA: allantoicase [Longimicrobiales bacterium]|nr:allantoicase [Longimicrobiales bacterium]